jgi:GGDEF domain-containing protein
MPQTSSDDAENVIGKLQLNLSAALERRSWPVTLSIGVVSFAIPTSAEEMIKRADDVMYSVKRNKGGTGGGRTQFGSK